MAILDDVKISLGGISHTRLDSEIEAAINAACLDLHIGGAESVDNACNADPLVVQAIKNYCRYWFNYQGNGEFWFSSYKALRDSMALCGLYNRGEDDEE